MKRRILSDNKLDVKRYRSTNQDLKKYDFDMPYDTAFGSDAGNSQFSFQNVGCENNNMETDDELPVCLKCQKVKIVIPSQDADPLCRRCLTNYYCLVPNAKSRCFLSDRHIAHLRRYKPSSDYPAIYLLESEVEKVALKIHRHVHWTVIAQFQEHRRSEYLRGAADWIEVEKVLSKFNAIDPYSFAEEYMRLHPPARRYGF